MTFNNAQYDMRYAYFGGGPGVLASGIVWIVAGLVALTVSIQASIIAIFLGGMLIHPLGIGLSRALKRPGKHQSGNPLGTLALETTLLLFIGLFLAFSTAQFRAELFFPVMLLIVGGRYLMFSTMYGMRLYWLLGALLAGVGALGLVFRFRFLLWRSAGGLSKLFFRPLSSIWRRTWAHHLRQSDVMMQKTQNPASQYTLLPKLEIVIPPPS